MIRYIELLRVSGLSQGERDTIEVQRHDLDRLRASHPGECVGRYEETVSGAVRLDDTEAGCEIIALACAGSLDELRVWDLDRAFGLRADRLGDQAVLYDLAHDYGMVIRDAKGTVIDPTSDNGKLIYSIRAVLASEERKKITRRTQRGREEAARKGRLPAGIVPYGLAWDADRQTWNVDDDKRQVVERILDCVIAGVAVPRVCVLLNDDKIAAPRGGLWRPPTIRKMIRGDYLIGRLIFKKIAIEVPAVVAEERLLAARQALALRAGKKGRKPREIHMLAQGRAYCGTCGLRMGTRQTPQGYAYRCNSTHHSRRLVGEPIHDGAWKQHQAERVDAAIWRAIERAISSPEILRGAVGGAENAAHWRDEVARHEERLTRQRGRREKLLRLESTGLITEDDLTKELARTIEDRRRWEAGLADARQQLARLESERVQSGQLAEQMVQVRGRIAGATFAERRRIFESLIPDVDGYGVIISATGDLEIRGAIAQCTDTAGAHRETAS